MQHSNIKELKSLYDLYDISFKDLFELKSFNRDVIYSKQQKLDELKNEIEILNKLKMILDAVEVFKLNGTPYIYYLNNIKTSLDYNDEKDLNKVLIKSNYLLKV